MNTLLQTAALTLMRVGTGLMMATHGYAKIFGGRMDGFTNAVGDMGFPVPVLFAWLAALSELVGGVLLALGLGTRISAFLIAGTMVVAAFIRHGADPFSDKELALLYLVVTLYFTACGGGRWALDRGIGCKG
jgi:putative oxidoreductase